MKRNINKRNQTQIEHKKVQKSESLNNDAFMKEIPHFGHEKKSGYTETDRRTDGRKDRPRYKDASKTKLVYHEEIKTLHVVTLVTGVAARIFKTTCMGGNLGQQCLLLSPYSFQCCYGRRGWRWGCPQNHFDATLCCSVLHYLFIHHTLSFLRDYRRTNGPTDE